MLMCTNPVNQPAVHQGEDIFSASGFCPVCNRVHGLFTGAARNHCRELMHHFQEHKTIDLSTSPGGDPRLATSYLFGPARGKMFGILECCDQNNATVILRAFSGQYNGLWLVPGWAPPLFDPAEFSAVNDQTEKSIKELGHQIGALAPHSPEWQDLRHKRRAMSRELMQRLHNIYRLTNFRGHTAALMSAFIGNGGIPTGTGDCCGPKLLHQAATLNLTPVSIAEFYWGKTNRSGSRTHGRFYPSCREKCQPILGHLLCGATQDDTP